MRVIAFVIAAGLVFSGCGSDQPKEPKHSAAPTITAPTMPPAAHENTVAGAVAFVRHYIDVFNYASNTGDVDELQRLSDPKCEGCTSYIKLYKGTYEAGGFYRNSNWTLANFEMRKSGKYSLVRADLTSAAGTYKSASGDSVHKGKPEDTKLNFLPIRASQGWKLYTFERQAN